MKPPTNNAVSPTTTGPITRATAARQTNGEGKRKSSIGKKRLDPPTTFGDIVEGVGLQIARRYLFVDLYKKAVVYLIGAFALSLVTDNVKLPNDWYLAKKGNILNQWFVKLGWFWTSSVLAVFIYFTSRVYSAGNNATMRRQFYRLIVGTVVWFVCTRLFVHVETVTGRCSIEVSSVKGRKMVITEPSACRDNGGSWLLGFDISGHCFLLIYCAMLMSEEALVFRNWLRLRDLLESTDSEPPELALLRPYEVEIALKNYRRYTPYIKATFIVVAMLHAIWDLMLLMTVLYYHTWPHKLAGTLVALAAWFVTYRLWYPSGLLTPGMPGQARMRYANYKRRPTAASSNGPTVTYTRY